MLKTLGRDIDQSRRIAERTLDLSPLSRVDASRSTETQNLLNMLNAQADPRMGGYAGGRSQDVADWLARMKESTQGYDSNEYNALRESKTAGLNQGFQTGRATLMRGQANSGAGSTARSAQLLDLARSFGRDRATAENDIYLKSADEKQKRLQTYGTELQSTETTEFDRGQSAQKNYADTLGAAQTSELGRAKINLGQEAASRSARASGILGVLQTLEARRNAKEQNAIAREQIGASKSNAAAAASGSSAYADALDALAKDLYGA